MSKKFSGKQDGPLVLKVEEVRTLFSLGIVNFKIQGRTARFEDIQKYLKNYVEGPTIRCLTNKRTSLWY